jgi:hypothetical protein
MEYTVTTTKICGHVKTIQRVLTTFALRQIHSWTMEWKPTYKSKPPNVNIKPNNTNKMGVLNHQDTTHPNST